MYTINYAPNKAALCTAAAITIRLKSPKAADRYIHVQDVRKLDVRMLIQKCCCGSASEPAVVSWKRDEHINMAKSLSEALSLLIASSTSFTGNTSPVYSSYHGRPYKLTTLTPRALNSSS